MKKNLEEEIVERFRHNLIFGRDPIGPADRLAYNIGVAIRFAIKIALAVLVIWGIAKLLGMI